jgi:hypothetical protein
MRHCKKSFRKLQRFLPRKRFVFRDFEVLIVNNRTKDFKFEWIIRPLKPMRHLKKFPVITDPTSETTLDMAIYTAKCAVNEMRYPMISEFYVVF